MINYGTYYKLEPKQGSVGSHVITRTIYLPVQDTISWSFNHVYNEADNLSKNIIDNLAQRGGALGSAISKFAQRKIGGSVHISSCALYVDSGPPALNVKTRMFSPDGSGSILYLLELFRQDTHGSLGGSGLANTTVGGAANDVIGGAVSAVNSLAGNSVAQGGTIDHPEWWNIQVVTYSKDGVVVLADMKDMLCRSMNVTFFSPFYGREPSMMDLELAFQYGFRGTRESMSFGPK
jgi:hypothetical protein